MKPLIVFFGLAYLLSWSIWLPLYGPVIGVHHLSAMPFQHALGGLGPLLAAFLTTWIYEKRKGVSSLFKKCIKVEPIIYLFIALLAPFFIAILAVAIAYFINKVPMDLTALLQAKEFPKFNLFTFFIYNLLFFGYGEETGWRGFALPRLQAKYNALMANIILTAFWALWHIPLFFYRPGYTEMEVSEVFGWIFSLLTGSVLLTWLYNASKRSILVCAVFHATIDIAFTAQWDNDIMISYIGILITIWGLIVSFSLYKQAAIKAQYTQGKGNQSGLQ